MPNGLLPDIKQSKQQQLLETLNGKFNIHEVCTFFPFPLLSSLQQSQFVLTHSLSPFEKLSDWKMIAPQEVENTKEGRALSMVHSSFASALRSLHPDIDWNSSPLNEREFHLRLLDGIKHKLNITQVKLTALLPLSSSSLSHTYVLYSGLGLVFHQQ